MFKTPRWVTLMVRLGKSLIHPDEAGVCVFVRGNLPFTETEEGALFTEGRWVRSLQAFSWSFCASASWGRLQPTDKSLCTENVSNSMCAFRPGFYSVCFLKPSLFKEWAFLYWRRGSLMEDFSAYRLTEYNKKKKKKKIWILHTLLPYALASN